MRKLAIVLAALFFAVGLSPQLLAQPHSFPSKPVRIIVPYPPGGAADVMARILAQYMSEDLKQPIVVDNRAGAQGGIGTVAVAKAAADGYTLLLFDSGVMAVNPVIEENVGYDPVADFTAVGLAAESPYALIVTPGLRAKNLKELAELARAKPNEVKFAAGSGTSRLAGELFQLIAGVKMLYVPYKGGAAAVNDLMGGHVDVSVAAAPSAVSMIKSGKVRALVVTGPTRLSTLPDVATSKEAGFPEFEVNGLNGLMAPSGTPPEVIARLHAVLGRTLVNPAVVEKFRTAGFEPSAKTPGETNALIKAELGRWRSVVKAAGITK